MRVVEEEPGVVALGQIEQCVDRRDVAVHAEHQIGDDELVRRVALRQLAFELRQITVAIARKRRAGKLRRIDQRSVIELVAKHFATPIEVAAAGQCGEHGQIGHVAGGKQQRGRLADELRKRGFKILVITMVAGDEVRRTRADTALIERGVAGGDHGRISGQAEIIVAAERDHALAVDRDLRALRAVEQQTPALEMIRLQRRQPLLQAGQRREAHDVTRLTVRPGRAYRTGAGRVPIPGYRW